MYHDEHDDKIEVWVGIALLLTAALIGWSLGR